VIGSFPRDTRTGQLVTGEVTATGTAATPTCKDILCRYRAAPSGRPAAGSRARARPAAAGHRRGSVATEPRTPLEAEARPRAGAAPRADTRMPRSRERTDVAEARSEGAADARADGRSTGRPSNRGPSGHPARRPRPDRARRSGPPPGPRPPSVACPQCTPIRRRRPSLDALPLDNQGGAAVCWRVTEGEAPPPVVR
jgi:hypothetical protein